MDDLVIITLIEAEYRAPRLLFPTSRQSIFNLTLFKIIKTD